MNHFFKEVIFMTGKIKKAIASIMAVASLSTCAIGISVSAVITDESAWYDVYCENQVSGGLTYYRGFAMADGDNYKVISGYINSSGGKVYASGSKYQMTTPWVASPATSGTGQFTLRYKNDYTVDISY